MYKTTVLLVLNKETDNPYLEEFALAAKDYDMRVSCFLLDENAAMPPSIYGATMYGTIDMSEAWQQSMAATSAALKKRSEEIKAVLAQTGCSADIQSVLCSTTEASEHVARCARVCDLAVLAPNLRETPDLFNAAAFGILYKTPIALMVNTVPTRPVKRALVAWDGSNAASSAVHNALNFLQSAEEVRVVCFDPITSQREAGAEPGADLAVWLSHHGCTVQVSQEPSGGKEISTCIEERAKEFGTDLIIMGAYGHSRLVQAVLGGTTRTLLAQNEFPVLMSH